MEYLTLQDIPHPHNPLHSRSMASSHSAERPLGSVGTANHHIRSSPPIQPGEQAFPGKLPSFSEFLNTTRQTTPPRTPNRSNGSAAASPPTFEEVAWSESKRRRVDSHNDIASRPSISFDQGPSGSRRLSSFAEATAPAHEVPRTAAHYDAPQPALASHHHRPSVSYQAPVHAPAPQGIANYASQSRRPSMVPPTAYAPTAAPQAPVYEQRPGYYPEHPPPPPGYTYDNRPQDQYYAHPAHPAYAGPAYEHSYGDIRFHQHVGLDQNAFSRKRRGNLPKEATNLLKQWFADHRVSPYPTEDEKQDLSRKTGLSLNQVSNWFINARRRAPQKEAREREANAQAKNGSTKNDQSSNGQASNRQAKK